MSWLRAKGLPLHKPQAWRSWCHLPMGNDGGCWGPSATSWHWSCALESIFPENPFLFPEFVVLTRVRLTQSLEFYENVFLVWCPVQGRALLQEQQAEGAVRNCSVILFILQILSSSGEGGFRSVWFQIIYSLFKLGPILWQTSGTLLAGPDFKCYF